MSEYLAFSRWAYRTLLFAYPRELRIEFGEEMALAFEEDIAAGWRKRHVTGIAAVWLCALRELFTVALPGRFSEPRVLVPALSFAFSLCVQGTELGLALLTALGRAHGALPPALPQLILGMVFFPAVACAFVGSIVHALAEHSRLVLLRLPGNPSA
jgi:hypothetical protein